MYGKKEAEAHGLDCVCYVDIDVCKQGSVLHGLRVLSFDQAREKYGDFNLFLTPDWEKHDEIVKYLIKNGLDKERILNAMEECAGCADLDSSLGVVSTGLFPCCRIGDDMNKPPVAWWEDSDKDIESTVLQYVAVRDRMVRQVRDAKECQCAGCAMIKTAYRPVKKKIEKLGLAIETSCQLSCIYCCFDRDSRRMYGVSNGSHKARDYDYKRFIEILEWQGLLDPHRLFNFDKHRSIAKEFDYKGFIEILERLGLLSVKTTIHFGAGEITINPRIDDILNVVEKYNLLVYTNAVIFNDRIASLAARPGSSMNISVDAGTRETYKLIKGADAFDRVWGNIKRYTDCGVKISAKCVVIKENSNVADMEGFAVRAVEAGVSELRVSTDHYMQIPLTDAQMRLIAKMLCLAEDNGLHFNFEWSIKADERYKILRYKCGET